MNKKMIAVIPARSGSKGLKDKNILPIGGRSMMGHTIKAAVDSGIFTRVVVSTDSSHYQQIAIREGAEAPFLRPESISGDNASSVDVVKHVLEYYASQVERFDYVMLLQPTSPLRNAKHIQEAFQLYLKNSQAVNDKLVSVVRVPNKMRWLLEKNGKYVSFAFNVDNKNPQRQALNELFMPNGAIYISPVNDIDNGFYGDQTLFYEMAADVSIDVDSIEDLNEVATKIKVSK